MANDKLTSVMIVDSDESVRYSLTNMLKKHYRRVIPFNSGRVAWESSQSNPFDAVVMAWQLPDISGAALFQKFRSHKNYYRAPIIVMTGNVVGEKLALLSEYMFCHGMQKPLRIQDVALYLDQLYSEAQWFETQEKKIQTLAIKGDTHSGFAELQEIISRTNNNKNFASKLYVMAGILMKDLGLFQGAEQAFRMALSQKSSSLMAIGELAKLYLLMERTDDAKKLFLEANSMNGENLERLCSLGQLFLEDMNPDKANTFFEEAKKLDKQDERVVSGKKIVGNIKSYMDTHGSLPESFSSLLNTIGITMVRMQQVNKGIEHYDAAMKQVRSYDTKAKLAFNIGYAYMRGRNYAKAGEWFQTALFYDSNHEKARKYFDQIKSKGVTEQKLSNWKLEEDPTLMTDEESKQDIDDILNGSNNDFLHSNKPLFDDEFDSFDSDNNEELSSRTSTEEQTPSKLHIESKEELLKHCPEVATWLKNAATLGIYLESQVPQLISICEQYGIEDFRQEIKKAITKEIYSTAQLASSLKKRYT